MQDKEFLSVKDVAEILDTEAYVLRFYEKELHLDIRRNSKGHREYTLEDVELLRKVQEMREKGLQLKAIEAIVHDSSKEAKETYEQLSGINLSAVAPVEKHEISEIDITNVEDEKVKQFSSMMKEMLKEAILECSEQSQEELKETIKQEVDSAVEEKVMQLQEAQDAKNEDYYKKLDETMREVQRMRKEMSEKQGEMTKKEKRSFWRRFFKDKNESAQI